MNILLTGATGFLGSNVAHSCIKEGHAVYGIIRENSDVSRLTDILDDARLKLVHTAETAALFDSCPIDIIIHTATSYGRNGETPEETAAANIAFPLDLLKLGMDRGLKAFINSDTFMELGPEDQKDRTYIATKKEFILRAREALGANSGTRFINMKIEQMYGPKDNPTKFIPFLIKEFLSGKDRIPLNPGLQTRDYIYVSDIAEAYLQAIDRLEDLGSFEEFGMGTGRKNTLQELAAAIKSAAASGSVPGFGDVPYHPREVMSSVANTQNNVKIGWRARTSLEKGMQTTVQYYKGQIDFNPARI